MIRRALASDAEGICELVEAVYNGGYFHPMFKRPDEVRQAWSEGSLYSVVALADDRVVGHYALERTPGHRAAETGVAVVDPGQRGGGLMGKMRAALEEWARELGLDGLFATAVTNHPFSQKTYDRQNCHPTGLVLGLRDVPTAGSPGHVALYAKYLKPPPSLKLFAPAGFQPLVAEIYAGLGARVTLSEPSGDQRGVTPTEAVPGVSQLSFPGDQPPDWRAAFLDLPLEQDGWAALAAEALEHGFVFAGVLPMRLHGDRLWLQRYPLDTVEVVLTAPLNVKVWDFIRSPLPATPSSPP